MVFFLNLIIALAIMIIAYLIMPKAKEQHPEIQQQDDPTAQAGIPEPVLFGTMTIKALNVLHFTEKRYKKRKVSA